SGARAAACAGRDELTRPAGAEDRDVAAMVVCPEPHAARIGGEILARGGNTVLNGECAIGSDPVPQAWLDTLAGRTELIGRYVVADDDNQIGAPSVMVPGFVACCWDLFHRLGSGRLSWAALLEPAIRLARDGFAVYPYIADTWALDGDGQAAARPGYPTLRAKLARDPTASA